MQRPVLAEVGGGHMAPPVDEAMPVPADEVGWVLRHVLNAARAMRSMNDPQHVLDILVSSVRLVVPDVAVWAARQSAGGPVSQAPPGPDLAPLLERWTARLGEGQPPFEAAVDDTTVTVVPMSSPQALGALVLGAPSGSLSGAQSAVVGLLCDRAATALHLSGSRTAAQHTETLFDMLTQLTASHSDAELVLQTVVRSTAELLGMDAAFVMLADDEGAVLTVRTAFGITRRSFYDASCRTDEWLPGAAIRKRQVVCVRDLHAHQQAKYSKPEGLRSTMCAPMFVEDQLIGVLLAAHREVRDASREDRRMMAALAGAAAVSIGNARLHAERAQSIRKLGDVNRLLEERSEALERTVRFQQSLTELVLAGSGLEEVVRVMTETLGRRVLVLDRDLAVLHSGGPSDELDLGALRSALATAEGEPVGAGLSRLHVGDERILVAPLELAGERTASVVVLEGEAPLEGTDLGMAEAAVTAIGLEMMRDRASAEAEARLTGGLFQTLLSGEDIDEATITRRASYLGYDLSGANAVIAVAVADDAPRARGFGHVSVQTCIQRAVRRHRQTPPAVFERDDQVCVVLSDPDDVPVDAVRELCGLIKQELEVSGRSAGARIAYSGAHAGIAGVRKAVGEAEYALHVLGVMGRAATPVAFSDLGVWSLLGRVSDRRHLESFADGVLGELIAHDAERHSQLVDTLRALVQCNFHYRSAAEALFAHPNTLRYRIARITELTGLDLTDGEDRLKVELALRVLDMIDLMWKPGAARG